MTVNRISRAQSETLFILLLLMQRGHKPPFKVSKVLGMVQNIRAGVIDPANYRKGIHTLGKQNLLRVCRFKDLSLGVELTASGMDKAKDIYTERMKQ